MKLKSYKLEVDPKCTTMDKYFDIMFRMAFPQLEKIASIETFKKAFLFLSKQHKQVRWSVVLEHRGREYTITVKDGELTSE